jgi:dephospho-CoA kinase
MTPAKPIILAVVGMPGSGKSLACQYFADQNLSVLRFGDQTDLGLKAQGLPLTEANERRYREKLRQELGMAAYAIKIKPRINQALKKSPLVILDGLYSWEEYLYLKNKFPQLYLLTIYSQPTTRYQRLTQRKTRPLTAQQAQQRDIDELENLNKAGPIAIADFLVKNDQTPDKLYQKLDKILADITRLSREK